jgi:hypothetical protein
LFFIELILRRRLSITIKTFYMTTLSSAFAAYAGQSAALMEKAKLTAQALPAQTV